MAEAVEIFIESMARHGTNRHPQDNSKLKDTQHRIRRLVLYGKVR